MEELYHGGNPLSLNRTPQIQSIENIYTDKQWTPNPIASPYRNKAYSTGVPATYLRNATILYESITELMPSN